MWAWLSNWSHSQTEYSWVFVYVTKGKEKQNDCQQSSGWVTPIHAHQPPALKFMCILQPSSNLFYVMNVWVIFEKHQALNLWIHGFVVCNLHGTFERNPFKKYHCILFSVFSIVSVLILHAKHHNCIPCGNQLSSLEVTLLSYQLTFRDNSALIFVCIVNECVKWPCMVVL